MCGTTAPERRAAAPRGQPLLPLSRHVPSFGGAPTRVFRPLHQRARFPSTTRQANPPRLFPHPLPRLPARASLLHPVAPRPRLRAEGRRVLPPPEAIPIRDTKRVSPATPSTTAAPRLCVHLCVSFRAGYYVRLCRPDIARGSIPRSEK